MTTAMLTLMIVLLLLGFPMLIPLIGAAMLGFFVFFSGMKPEIMIQQMVGGVKPAALIAVPMFILAADIITRGHSADRLLDLVMRFVGHLKGGLAVTTATACTLFGAVSGSTQATVVAIGGPLRPRMLQAGYKDSFVMALAINASDIAFLIPPSIGMIIYGVVSGTSIAELFIAGIGPGVLILLMFSAYSVAYAARKRIPTIPKTSWRARLVGVRRAIWPLGFPVIIIGGIYGGIFSPTEAASVSVLYALLLEVVIFRSLKLSQIPEIALSTGLITAVVFILVAAGAAFSWTISFAQIPQAILGGLGLDEAGPYTVLIAISIAFFIGCMFVDPIVVILILVPIFAPIVDGAGLDPVLVGTIIVLQVTPPFIFMLVLASALLIIFPQIALFLRDLAFR